MRQIFTILIAVVGLGMILSGSRYLDRAFTVRADITRDKAQEKLFQDSAEIARLAKKPEGDGYKTIPYADLQRECKPLMDDKRAACHPKGEGLPGCGDQEQNLKNARIHRDIKKIADIRQTCEKRLEALEACSLARKAGIPVWDEAFDRVTRDKARFNQEQQKAKTRKDPATQFFYQRMVGYADKILEYYGPAIKNHKDEDVKADDGINKCKKIMHLADMPLE